MVARAAQQVGCKQVRWARRCRHRHPLTTSGTPAADKLGGTTGCYHPRRRVTGNWRKRRGDATTHRRHPPRRACHAGARSAGCTQRGGATPPCHRRPRASGRTRRRRSCRRRTGWRATGRARPTLAPASRGAGPRGEQAQAAAVGQHRPPKLCLPVVVNDGHAGGGLRPPHRVGVAALTSQEEGGRRGCVWQASTHSTARPSRAPPSRTAAASASQSKSRPTTTGAAAPPPAPWPAAGRTAPPWTRPPTPLTPPG